MKILVSLIAVIAVFSASLACGQGATIPTMSPSALDRVVPRLPNGLSPDEVEERLGTPRARFETEHGYIVMIYGLWHVVFHPSLFVRTRYYAAGYRPNQPIGSLDRKVRAVKLGVGKRTVERELGKTEAWEIFTLESHESIWYGKGRWELRFSDRRLSGKRLYK